MKKILIYFLLISLAISLIGRFFPLLFFGTITAVVVLLAIGVWGGRQTTSHTGGNPPVPTATDWSKYNLNPKTVLKIPSKDEMISFLNAKILGQSEAINNVSTRVIGKLASSEVIEGDTVNNPLVFFLAGPTGTGKTELAKTCAHFLEASYARFDMGEYSTKEKITNLLGSSKGYIGSEDGGALPNAIRKSSKNGRYVFLFDEVEKSHPELWRSLLAFFDEGRATDTLGEVIASKNTICFLTSNIKADDFAKEPERAKDILAESKVFPPEFVGRVSKVIPMLRLDSESTAKLVVIMAKQIGHNHGIDLQVDPEALPLLLTKTSDDAQKYGGRGIRDKLTDLLSDELVELQIAQRKKAMIQDKTGEIVLEVVT